MNLSNSVSKLKRKAVKEPSEEEPLTQEMKIQDESESGDIEELIDEKIMAWSLKFRIEIEQMIQNECRKHLNNKQEILPTSLRFAQPSEINLLSKGNITSPFSEHKPLITTKPFPTTFQQWIHDEDSS